jgi:hypothetical protein
MSIDAKLAELGDYATHLGEYVKSQYSPANVLRRHIGPAIGIAATLGTLAAGAKAPGTGFMRLIWSRLLHRENNNSNTKQAPGQTGSSPPSTDAVSAAHGGTHSPQPRHRGLRDVAEPIVTNIIMDVAQAIPWRSLLQRVREKHNDRDGQTDQKDPSRQ